jgi:hypothetical protein
MRLRRSVRPLRPDLDRFLFAAVEDEIDGIRLSLISALSPLDPWQEAGRLSSLARREAVEQLTRLIAEIPGIFRPAVRRERLPIDWLVYSQSTTTAVQRPRKCKSARVTADRRLQGRRNSGSPALCSRQPCWSAQSSTTDLFSTLVFHTRD